MWVFVDFVILFTGTFSVINFDRFVKLTNVEWNQWKYVRQQNKDDLHKQSKRKIMKKYGE